MPKPKIRPARVPPRESPKVTIAYLNLQVKMLTQRCVDLVTSRDQETNRAIKYRQEEVEAQRRAEHSANQNHNLRVEMDGMLADLFRLRGYQERVREEDKHRYGDLTGANVR